MKKLLIILAAVALVGLMASGALAETTANAVVTVTVQDVESLVVSDATFALSLTQAPANAGNAAYDQTVTPLGQVSYSHNYLELRSIKVTAVHRAANHSNDITLKLNLPPAYNGGKLSDTLVAAGVDSGTGAVWRIVRGSYVAGFIWTVDGTLANTPRGAYIWDVHATTQADPGA